MESDVSGAPEKRRKEALEVLFSWGVHDYGQLGLGETEDSQIPSPQQVPEITV